MTKHRDPSRVVASGLLACGLAVVGIAFTSATVSAECDGPISSFREVIRTAQRVVIGDVSAIHDGGLTEASEADGLSSRFTLDVLHTPVGAAPPTLEIADLSTQPCAPVVVARQGDRIAIAFGATDFTPPIEVNTIAWLEGTAYDHPGIETITIAEVFRLLGLAPPETSTLDDSDPDKRWKWLLIVLPASALGGSIAWTLHPAVRRRQIGLNDSNGWRQERQ